MNPAKYLSVYAMSLQDVLQRRASLLMDRIGGLAFVLALYFFWDSLLKGRDSFLGYSRPQMLSYVLAMNILRSFVFTGRGWELVHEISSGRLSNYLLRPVSYLGYCLSLDMAQKSIHVAAAVFEVGTLILVFHAPLYLPHAPGTWALFLAATLMSSLLFFLLEFVVSSLAFWTSESGGPLFCFELFLQFAAGAFFPLDVLPLALRRALEATPFPYMVYFPVRIFLEKVSPVEALRILGMEALWLAAVYAAAMTVWRRGVRSYAAEGG